MTTWRTFGTVDTVICLGCRPGSSNPVGYQRVACGPSLPPFLRCRYNIGQVAIGIADLGLAYQAFKIAVSINSHHAESFNNLGVLELRKGNIDQARSNFTTAYQIAPFMFESFFNAGRSSLPCMCAGVGLVHPHYLGNHCVFM
jgi:hypothetical protein